MPASSCYLDNSATTRPFDEVIAAVAHSMADGWHNPSAAYPLGLTVEDEISRARALIGKALGGGRLVFTSGGTEADNLAIFGAATSKRSRFVTSAVEHPAVLAAFEELRARGQDVIVLPVDGSGLVPMEALADAVNENTALVSVMHVNNETGAIHDIERFAAVIRSQSPGAVFHSDGVQAFLKVPAQPAKWGVGLYSVSAHKVHGPKGVGALLIGDAVRLQPHLHGGGQEQGMRSGTENTHGILGFAKAVEVYSQGLEQRRAAMMQCKLALAEGLLAIDGAAVNGPAPEDGAPHILNVSFEGVTGEVLLRALAEQGVFVSTGSACGARQRKPSTTLKAMGLSDARVGSAIRFSLSTMNTMEDIARAAEAVSAQVKRLRLFKRR